MAQPLGQRREHRLGVDEQRDLRDVLLHHAVHATGTALLRAAHRPVLPPLGLSILVAAGVAAELVRLLGVRLATAIGALLGVAGLVWFAQIPARGHLLTDIIVPSVISGLGAGLVLMTTTIAGMSGVAATRSGVASALLNVSRQLGGALGLAAISTIIASVSAHSAVSAPVALTNGFRAGFTVSAGLLAAAVLTALALFRADGRGQRINPVELQSAA